MTMQKCIIKVWQNISQYKEQYAFSTWKIDGMRILFDDYTISAEYRLTNSWAFIVSGLVLVIAVTGIVLLIRKRAKKR